MTAISRATQSAQSYSHSSEPISLESIKKSLECSQCTLGKAQAFWCRFSNPEFEKWNVRKLGFFPIAKVVDKEGLLQIRSTPAKTLFFNVPELIRRGIFPLKEVIVNGEKGLRAANGSAIFFKTS